MRILLLLALLLIYTGCDHGLEPPDALPLGSIRGTVTYVGEWPPSDSLNDLRFFALPFVPRDMLDLFSELNQLVFSDRLAFNPAGTRLLAGDGDGLATCRTRYKDKDRQCIQV